MTALADSMGTHPRAGQPALRLVVEVGQDLEAFLARCARLREPHTLPFQSEAWLRAWYTAFHGHEGRQPLLVAVSDAATGTDLMLMPWCTRRLNGLSVVEFADAGVTDYNAPLVAAGWLPDAQALRQLRQALQQALRGHDVLRIEKMLAQSLGEAGAAVNPLMRCLPTQTCAMFGNEFHVPGTWDEWRYSLDKRVRKEFERSWRVFTRSEEARFERVTEPAAALELFEQLETQQSTRMRALGQPYVLDEPVYRHFYRLTLQHGLANSSVVLTALRDGEHVVAAQFGVASRDRYIAVRQSIGGDAWKHCSPGKLLDKRTSRHIHEWGLRWFDFGIGDYFHKETFNVSHIPLHDACVALSWRGWPYVWGWALRRRLKRQAWLVDLWRRLHRSDRPS